MEINKRRCWAEIDLDALASNMRIIRNKTDKKAKVMAVVKADGYGHGAVQIARTLLENGADELGVSCVYEAVQLRMAGITAPILIFGQIFPADMEAVVKNNITTAAFNIDLVKELSETAMKYGVKAKVHIKLDTGMHRIGVIADREDSVEKVKEIAKLPGIEIEGVFSHFSCADTEKEDFTKKQFEIFMKTVEKIENEVVKFKVKHIANSAAIFRYPETHLDMVRAGIVCYGCYPSEEVANEGLVPVMSFKTSVSRVETLREGDCVSYGATFKAEEGDKIASLSVGYADGYSRILSDKANVLLCGEKAKIVGRICMDQCMVNVSRVNNICVGDVATLFGKDGDSFIPVEEIAQLMGTINYEVLCMVGKRVPRIYIKQGEYISELNYII